MRASNEIRSIDLGRILKRLVVGLERRYMMGGRQRKLQYCLHIQIFSQPQAFWSIPAAGLFAASRGRHLQLRIRNPPKKIQRRRLLQTTEACAKQVASTSWQRIQPQARSAPLYIRTSVHPQSISGSIKTTTSKLDNSHEEATCTTKKEKKPTYARQTLTAA